MHTYSYYCRPYLSPPVKHVSIGWVPVEHLWPTEGHQTLQEEGSVLESTVGVGAHLSSVEELVLVLLLNPVSGGHKP